MACAICSRSASAAWLSLLISRTTFALGFGFDHCVASLSQRRQDALRVLSPFCTHRARASSSAPNELIGDDLRCALVFVVFGSSHNNEYPSDSANMSNALRLVGAVQAQRSRDPSRRSRRTVHSRKLDMATATFVSPLYTS
jgi:hypothetical protein